MNAAKNNPTTATLADPTTVRRASGLRRKASVADLTAQLAKIQAQLAAAEEEVLGDADIKYDTVYSIDVWIGNREHRVPARVVDVGVWDRGGMFYRMVRLDREDDRGPAIFRTADQIHPADTR